MRWRRCKRRSVAPRPELRTDIRSFPYGNYVIFFRYIEDRFEVVSILERHLDIDSNYGGFDPP
jgi:toxin ParE1/3/4